MTELVLADARDPRWQAAAQALRLARLRAPWGQPLEADPAPGPSDDLVLLEGAEVVATGRLFVAPDGGEARIRSMAVRADREGRGYATRILQALEARARGRGCSVCLAQARTTALPFYLRHGYVDSGPGPLLFGQIPHRQIRKTIDHADFSPWALSLRPARDADGPALEQLIFEILAEYGMAPEQDGLDQDLQALTRTYAGGLFEVLCDARGHIVGSLALLPLTGQRMELRRMYLHQDQRHGRLGRAVLGRLLWLARRRGCTTLELETASRLEAALHLYRWAGFAPYPGTLETQRCDQRLQLRLSPVPDADARQRHARAWSHPRIPAHHRPERRAPVD